MPDLSQEDDVDVTDEEDDIILEQDDDDDVDGGNDEIKDIETIEKNLENSKSRLVNSDKDSSVDDPIRLYLREIGKENLLTADQEVELSKQMGTDEKMGFKPIPITIRK